jgi:hypothetical protein
MARRSPWIDVEGEDAYGRILAYAYLTAGSMFSETHLQEGYAQIATSPPTRDTWTASKTRSGKPAGCVAACGGCWRMSFGGQETEENRNVYGADERPPPNPISTYRCSPTARRARRLWPSGRQG